MLIALDIGNTAVTYGLYGGGRLHDFGSCLIDNIPKLCHKWSKSGALEYANSLVISSVVPKKRDFIADYFSKKQGFKLWIAGKSLPISIPNKYKKKNTLGIDRIVCLWGAIRIYKPPFLLMDLGTGITADYVSKKSVFEGGMIIPGPDTAFQALMDRTALLPKNLPFPKKTAGFLGQTTLECMNSGILEGYGAMMDGLIGRFRSKYGQELRVITTGGYASVLKPYISSQQTVDPQLSIKSLILRFKEYTRRKK